MFCSANVMAVCSHTFPTLMFYWIWRVLLCSKLCIFCLTDLLKCPIRFDGVKFQMKKATDQGTSLYGRRCVPSGQ